MKYTNNDTATNNNLTEKKNQNVYWLIQAAIILLALLMILVGPVNLQASAKHNLECPTLSSCGGASLSDVRLKTYVKKLSVVNDIQLYEFKYTNDAKQKIFVGVMAQDLVGDRDDALLLANDGYYRVFYAKLGLKMATLDDWKKVGPKAVLLNTVL